MTAGTPGQAPLLPIPAAHVCGLCRDTFNTSRPPGDIVCPECDAQLCPCCGQWFGCNGETAREITPGPAPAASASTELAAAMAESREIRAAVGKAAASVPHGWARPGELDKLRAKLREIAGPQS